MQISTPGKCKYQFEHPVQQTEISVRHCVSIRHNVALCMGLNLASSHGRVTTISADTPFPEPNYNQLYGATFIFSALLWFISKQGARTTKKVHCNLLLWFLLLGTPWEQPDKKVKIIKSPCLCDTLTAQ